MLSITTVAHAEHWLWRCQQLYNAALEQRITAYKRCGVTLTRFDQNNELPDLKAALPEFKAVGSQVLQDVMARLDKAMKAFFSRLKAGQGKAGFPRFRARDRYDSFTLSQAGWKLKGRHLHIKGVGTFKLHLSRPVEGKIKTVTVRRDACGGDAVAIRTARKLAYGCRFGGSASVAKSRPKPGPRRLNRSWGLTWV